MAETCITFVQWKGTHLCMDFTCPKCGTDTHFCGMFAYAIRCGGCGQDYKMPQDIGPLLTPLDPGHGLQALEGQSDD